MWSRDDGIRQWAGFTKQPAAAGTAACYLMSLMLLLAPRRTQLGGKLWKAWAKTCSVHCSHLSELVLSHFIPEVPAGRAGGARLFWETVTPVSSLPQTSMPMFRSKQFSVKRRFSDFLGLYEKLSEKHAQNGFIVPPPPEKSLIGE